MSLPPSRRVVSAPVRWAQAAVLMAVEVLALPRVRQPREHQKIVFGEFQRPQDGRKLAERTRRGRFPGFENGAAGDRENAQSQRRTRRRKRCQPAARLGKSDSRNGKAMATPAPRSIVRLETCIMSPGLVLTFPSAHVAREML